MPEKDNKYLCIAIIFQRVIVNRPFLSSRIGYVALWNSSVFIKKNLFQQPTPTMMSLFCLYGYSLSIYIPVAILWTIQVSWLQWLFVIMAAFVSGAVLIFWLMPALRKSKYFPILMGCILGFHFLLAAGFMLYFFHTPSSSGIVPVSPPAPLVSSTPAKVI